MSVQRCVHLLCDGESPHCQLTTRAIDYAVMASSAKEAREQARPHGWVYERKRDLCPECVDHEQDMITFPLSDRSRDIAGLSEDSLPMSAFSVLETHAFWRLYRGPAKRAREILKAIDAAEHVLCREGKPREVWKLHANSEKLRLALGLIS